MKIEAWAHMDTPHPSFQVSSKGDVDTLNTKTHNEAKCLECIGRVHISNVHTLQPFVLLHRFLHNIPISKPKSMKVCKLAPEKHMYVYEDMSSHLLRLMCKCKLIFRSDCHFWKYQKFYKYSKILSVVQIFRVFRFNYSKWQQKEHQNLKCYKNCSFEITPFANSFLFKKKRDSTISVAKTKALISFAVGYREADLRLCFRICKSPVFSRRGSYVMSIEPRREKTGFLHMRKQSRRSVSR